MSKSKTTISVYKKNEENTMNLIKRFRSKVRNSGLLILVKKRAYYEKIKSKFFIKQNKLNKIKKQKEYEYKIKMGKIK